MNELSTYMKVAIIAVAFIAGYAIVSYVVGFFKRANARRSGNDRSQTGSPFSRHDDSDSDSKPR